MGEPPPPYWKSIQPPDVGSPGPRSSLTQRCSSMSDCEAKKTGNRKASLTESTVTMGEGTGATVRVSSVTGRKLTLTSWLPSKICPRASVGYFHEGEQKKKKKRRHTHTEREDQELRVNRKASWVLCTNHSVKRQVYNYTGSGRGTGKGRGWRLDLQLLQKTSKTGTNCWWRKRRPRRRWGKSVRKH